MKVIVVYDTPWGEQCDKRWLYEGLAQKYDCELVVPSKVIDRFMYEGFKGILKAYAWDFRLALQATRKAKPGDVIVVWQWRTGLLTSALARKGATVISLCWLTPQPGERLAPLSKKALGKEGTWVGVNSPATRTQLGAVYGVEDLSRVSGCRTCRRKACRNFKSGSLPTGATASRAA